MLPVCQDKILVLCVENMMHSTIPSTQEVMFPPVGCLSVSRATQKQPGRFPWSLDGGAGAWGACMGQQIHFTQRKPALLFYIGVGVGSTR